MMDKLDADLGRITVRTIVVLRAESILVLERYRVGIVELDCLQAPPS